MANPDDRRPEGKAESTDAQSGPDGTTSMPVKGSIPPGPRRGVPDGAEADDSSPPDDSSQMPKGESPAPDDSSPPLPAASSRSRLGWPVLVIALYTTLACAALYPASIQPNSRIVGGGELGGWLWRYWLMKLELTALRAELSGEPLQFFLQMISLGRFPETGNIADLYLMSWPLDAIFGHPAYYNIKCLLILILNALAGYGFSSFFTKRRSIAFVGGLVMGFNSFVFLELYESGLRQAILWWMILAMLYLEKVLKEGRLRDGLWAGIFFGLTASFYWFYGLFLGMYAVPRVLVGLPRWFRSGRKRSIALSMVLLGLVGLGIAYVFAYPYIYLKTDHTGALPELQWFQNFPTLEALQNAPKFPQTLKENLLSSLARVLTSSWSIEYLWDPRHPRFVPLALGVMAIIPALVRVRKEWFWLAVLVFFWLHTGGPYLQQPMQDGERVFSLFHGETIKLPYYYTFKYVPVMSRLFAPYRSGGLVWIALAILLVRNLDAIAAWSRHLGRRIHLIAAGFMVLYLGQHFLDDTLLRALDVQGVGLSGRGLPIENSVMTVHPFYKALAQEEGKVGLIELPLQVQQDLINFYQVMHQKKVFKGWAVPGALPTALRFKHHSEKKETQRLMWIVEPDTPLPNTFARALERLNEPPHVLGEYDPDDLLYLGKRGFKYAILHERGCYLVWPERGKALYEASKRRLAKHLGHYAEFVELVTPADPEFGQIDAGLLGEWASSAVPGQAGHITRFRMAIYRMPGYTVEGQLNP